MARLAVLVAAALLLCGAAVAMDGAGEDGAGEKPDHLSRLPSDLLRGVVDYARKRSDGMPVYDDGESDDEGPSRATARSINKRFARVVKGMDWVPADGRELERMEAARTGRYHVDEEKVMERVKKFHESHRDKEHMARGRFYGPDERDMIREFRTGIERHVFDHTAQKIIILPGTYKETVIEEPVEVFTDSLLTTPAFPGHSAYDAFAQSERGDRPSNLAVRAAERFLEKVKAALEGASHRKRSFAFLTEPGAVRFANEIIDYSGGRPMRLIVLGGEDSTLASVVSPETHSERTLDDDIPQKIVILPGDYDGEEVEEPIKVLTHSPLTVLSGRRAYDALAQYESGGKPPALLVMAAKRFLEKVKAALEEGAPHGESFGFLTEPGAVRFVNEIIESAGGRPERVIILGGEGSTLDDITSREEPDVKDAEGLDVTDEGGLDVTDREDADE